MARFGKHRHLPRRLCLVAHAAEQFAIGRRQLGAFVDLHGVHRFVVDLAAFGYAAAMLAPGRACRVRGTADDFEADFGGKLAARAHRYPLPFSANSMISIGMDRFDC